MKRLLVFLLLGCTAMSSMPLPSDPTPSQTVLTTGMPAGVTATALTVSPNPVTISLGQTQRLSVTMKLSNGKTSTDPTWVRWSLGDPQSAVIDAQGVVTPKLPRTTKIVAEVSSLKVEVPLTITQANYNWQQVDSPTSKDLYGVKMLSALEAWAVGDDSTMLHLVNSYWQPIQAPIDNTKLRGVDFADNSHGWAVGQNSSTSQIAILRYLNGSWTNLPQSQAGTLYAVSAVDATHAWAVGEDNSGKILIMRNNGAGWYKDSTYSGNGRLRALHMLGSIGWAVGSDGNDALVLNYDGSGWSKEGVSPIQAIGDTVTTSELTGIQMIDSQQGYAVGVRKTPLYKKGLVLKYDSRTGWTNPWHWSYIDAFDAQVSYLDQVPLNGLYLSSGTQGWLLGETIDPKNILNPGSVLTKLYGNLLDWDSGTYRLDTMYRKTNLSTKFQAIDVLPSGEGVIVGTSGYLMQRKYDWQGT